MLFPGKSKSHIIIHLDEHSFKRGDVLSIPQTVIITKVYKYNLWRKFLCLLGIKFKMFNCIKVKNHENNN